MSTQQPFPNDYTHRTAQKEGPCFVCSKYTTAVLTTSGANANASGNSSAPAAASVDWFFVCLSHLNDYSFAKWVNPPTPTPTTVGSTSNSGQSKTGGSPGEKKKKDEDVKDKDKEKEKEKEKSGEDKSKDKEKDKEDKEKEKEKEKEKKSSEEKDTKPKQQSPAIIPTGPKRYALDSRIFYLRIQERKKKEQKKEAKAVIREFPSVPKHLPS